MAGGFAAAAIGVMQEALRSEIPDKANAEDIPAPPAARAARVGIHQVRDNPVMSVMQAPIRLFKHLVCMREELVEQKNVSEAVRLVRGMRFDKYEEHVCACQYKGIPIVNPDPGLPANHPEKFPFQKIVTDVCEQYKLDEHTRQNLLNAKLCDESTMLNFDIKFNVGETGIFYYGKFMAVNIQGKLDFCFMFYRLNYKIAADVIETTHARKFLWFTVDTWRTYHNQEVVMDAKQLEDFQNFFRLRLFDLLGGEIKGLADTEPPDALDALEA